MLPQFGEYFSFTLDPVTSLKLLNDAEVTEACKAICIGKTYVASVINLLSSPISGTEYVSVALTLVSKAILLNTSNSLSQPPLEPSVPLPWPDCFHPTQSMMTCRIKNDIILGKPWPPPKCHIDGHAQNLLGRTYFYEDANCREALRQAQEPLSTTDKPEECEASSVISSPPEAPIRSLQ
ncbi:hypothetical protein F5146DRAFT_1145151 [Armillaria mellea]|nr:hypothetical protein F5146DRAFT_1145151 [Armillaria mellea]